MPGKLAIIILVLLTLKGFTQPIDRRALVERHTIINTKADTLSSLSVGNGRFAFTVDVTGLQTFPEYYKNGVPLGTQSEWGWHSFKDTANYKFEETLKNYHFNGRDVSYSTQVSSPKRNRDADNWFRENVHRLQLGSLGLLIYKKNGSLAKISDLKHIHQQLNMWIGEVNSHFEVEGIPVDVVTYGHQDVDAVAFKINSALIKLGRLKVQLKFPYPTNQFADMGVNYKDELKHTSEIYYHKGQVAFIRHTLNTASYSADFKWAGKAEMVKISPHCFNLIPHSNQNVLEVSCLFAKKSPMHMLAQVPSFSQTQANNLMEWPRFWKSGGAVDLSGSTDSRAEELERRIVLSQYLTKIQCAGNYPPQETGLTYNSWYGKPHLEMHWWHGVHFALWGRPELLESSLGWYDKVKDKAAGIAQRQGYKGVRWQKMTDPEGNESPSSVGSFLIWQQPHFIYMAELAYRDHPDKETLLKYKDLVFATADFMASYAFYDQESHHYRLGKGLIPAQEVHKAQDTYNPTYELAYWHWALGVAQEWKKRLNEPEVKTWLDVGENLSSLPQQNGVYLPAESVKDAYTNPKMETDHPSLLAAYGMLPYSTMMDTTVMHRSFDLIWKTWSWKNTWGWDFPMTAMTATRLNMPDKAIDALFMPVKTNTYLPDGHNYQDKRLTIYLPGNGGLLTAVALMCAGWDGCTTDNPGFPKNGRWKVKWEGLKKMP
jgi:hypothetical protein